MSRVSVGIIGCGWVGKALLKALQQQAYNVISTYRSDNSKQTLLAMGAKIELLSLPLADDEKQRFDVLDQDVIIIAIPPRLRHSTDYPSYIKQIVKKCEQHNTKHVVLISSTAIYNGLGGDVDEHSELNLEGDKVKYLQEAELYVQAFSKQTTILRLAGLIGPERHPSRFVKAGKVSDNPDNPVNLIHQTDVVGLLLKIIDTTSTPEFVNQTRTYNGVADTHCSRKEFYEAAAESQNLDQPVFSERHTQTSRTVNAQVTRQLLDYQYQHDNLLSWLKSDTP